MPDIGVAGTAAARRPREASALPADAAAIIEPAERSVTQAGAGRVKGWRLRFRPRGRAWQDPLTGWAGNDDPLAHLALHFPTLEAATGYARRLGLAFELRRAAPATARRRAAPCPEPIWLCCWPSGPHALCCGEYPPMRDRAAAGRFPG